MAGQSGSDELRREYRFDYRKAQPNRFAGRAGAQTVVVLDPEMSRAVPTAESVNQALRTWVAGSRKPKRATVK